jgi:hypothetical protein
MTRTTIAVLGTNPIEVDLPLDQYYGDTVIEYTCSGNTLQIPGHANGAFFVGVHFTRQ